MESMNLFGDTKPKKKTYTEDFKKKAVNLASKIGVTKAAEELGVSTSSIYSWQKTLAKSSTPIQDENGNLTFTLNTSEITTRDKDVCFNLEGKIYSLNVNSEEERERVKEEVNANSLAKYDWFKEETGEEYWVLYNTEMYEIIRDDIFYLHYKEYSNLTPIIPINATSCYLMFNDCSKLTSLDLSSFDTSNVTDMSGMFYKCSSFTTLGLSNLDTSNVTDMRAMFDDCSSLTSLDLSSFDTSKVTDMGYMFCYCSRLISLDLSSFDTSNVTDMRYMFCSCSSLISLDLSSFDTSRVISMHEMFYYCASLTTLDLSNFNTSKVIDMCSMFRNCSSLIDIYISDKWNINSVKHSNGMLKECYSLPNFNSSIIDKTKAYYGEGGYLTLKI